MNTTERTFVVDKDVETVVAYLADFGNAEQWDPGTQSCVRSNDGPVQVGATWHNVSEFNRRDTELEHRLDTLEPGHIVFIGENKTATSTDDITVVPADSGADSAAGGSSGSSITYRSEVVFHGIAKVAGPFVQHEFERLGDKTVEGITREVAKL